MASGGAVIAALTSAGTLYTWSAETGTQLARNEGRFGPKNGESAHRLAVSDEAR